MVETQQEEDWELKSLEELKDSFDDNKDIQLGYKDEIGTVFSLITILMLVVVIPVLLLRISSVKDFLTLPSLHDKCRVLYDELL